MKDLEGSMYHSHILTCVIRAIEIAPACDTKQTEP